MANETTKEWLSGVLVFEVSGKFLDKRSKGHSGGGSSKSDEIKGLQLQLQQQQLLLQHLDALLHQRGQSLPQLLSEGKAQGIITAGDVEAAQAATANSERKAPAPATAQGRTSTPEPENAKAAPLDQDEKSPSPEEAQAAVEEQTPSPDSLHQSPREDADKQEEEETSQHGVSDEDA